MKAHAQILALLLALSACGDAPVKSDHPVEVKADNELRQIEMFAGSATFDVAPPCEGLIRSASVELHRQSVGEFLGEWTTRQQPDGTLVGELSCGDVGCTPPLEVKVVGYGGRYTGEALVYVDLEFVCEDV